MLKWVQNSRDHKPDFDIDDANPGQVLTLQIGKNTSFSGRWLYAYSLEVSASNSIDFPEIALSKGTWYARHRINGGKWGNIVTLVIA